MRGVDSGYSDGVVRDFRIAITCYFGECGLSVFSDDYQGVACGGGALCADTATNQQGIREIPTCNGQGVLQPFLDSGLGV